MASALCCGTLAAQPGQQAPANEAFALGRILVMPRAGMSDVALARILSEQGGGKGRRVGKSDLHIVDIAVGTEKAMVERLARHPQIKFAEIDERVAADLVPNDPYLGSEWHITKIGATTAWDISQGAGIKIAILDTGVDGTHPDLVARMVPGWNFYDNNSNTSDVNGHGTHVAGAAAASSNNGMGVASVAGQSLIMPVRIASPSAYAYWSTVAQGITWAADHGARVANLSYGGATKSSTVQSAAQYLKSKGGLLVVSAGNNGIDEGILPTTSLIPVSATDNNDVKTSWSSYGSYVALSSPGAGIYTTSRGGGYTAASGTSLAAPITAGVIALMMAAKPSLTNAVVESLLFKTAVDLGAVGRDSLYGYGRVAAGAAVKAALATTISADTQLPTASISAPLGSATVTGTATVSVNATDNVGVARVELRVNGALLGTDTAAPYSFSWDTTKVASATANLVATAYDAAGNAGNSAVVYVTVSNVALATAVDTTAPTVLITNPLAGAKLKGVVGISVAASDNGGAAGIRQTLYVNGQVVATASGGTLTYNWNTTKVLPGTYTIKAYARDGAGNATTVTRSVVK